MIILDTNVISEVMRLSPSPAVMIWLDARPAFDLATTTISVAEIGFVLARLPFGRRRTERERLFNSFIARALGVRIFGFDRLADDTYGELVAARERSGRPLEGPDGFRDVRGFEGRGIELVNLWEAGAA